jgi:hypothetical protein
LASAVLARVSTDTRAPVLGAALRATARLSHLSPPLFNTLIAADMKGRLLLLGLVATGVLLACDEPPPPPPPVTPAPSGSTSLSPQVYLLQRQQLSDYALTSSEALSSDNIAELQKDPTLKDKLDGFGLVIAARAVFQPPQGGRPPFGEVISQVYMFRDAKGAADFFADELARRSRPISGQTVSPVSGLPSTGVDQLSAIGATLRPPTLGDPTPQAYLAVMRRGRLVAEVSGTGIAGTATVGAFTPLVTAQQQLLGTSPDV